MHDLLISRPLLCAELIGRERELEQLRQVLAEAAQGHPRLILLASEAGLGKTRLSQALAQSVVADQAQPPLVLLGQASLSEQALAFGPFLDAFRRYFSPLVGGRPLEAPAALPYLIHLLPELQSSFPGLTPTPIPASSDSAQRQRFLFQIILAGLQTLIGSQAGPVLLVLEDLHWADETSLELLAFLTRQLGLNSPQAEPCPLMILGTYRPDALPQYPALGRLLMQLNQRRQLQELKLVPLNQDQHAQMLTSILGQPVSPEYARLFYERDEGNPFFIEELLGALAALDQLKLQDGEWLRQPGLVLNLPLSIKASIVERVAGLPSVDQEVLAYAAVMGRRFDFDRLAGLVGLGERELLAVLRRATTLQLINEVNSVPSEPMNQGSQAERVGKGEGENEVYEFRHALTREAIYGDMLARERRTRHRAVAELLEAEAATTAQTRLTYLITEHFWLAGLPHRARPYALQEAARVRSLFAFAEERYYLQIALASLKESPPEGDQENERLQLLHRLGQLGLAVGDVKAALGWLNEAKEGYQRLGQHRQVVKVIVDLTLLAWFFDPPQHDRLLQEQEAAATALFDDPATVPDVTVLAVYCQAACGLALADQHARAAMWLERSRRLADQVADEPTRFAVLQMRNLAEGVSLVEAGGSSVEIEAGMTSIRQVLDFARNYSLPDLAMLTYGAYLLALLDCGAHEQTADLITELNAYEARSGLPPMTNLKGFYYYYTGNWSEALKELEGGIQTIPIPTVNALYRVTLVHLLIARHELEAAQTHLEKALPLVETLQFAYAAPALWGCARLQVALKQPQAAEVYFEQVLRRWQTTDDRGTMLPILLDGLKFYADYSNLAHSRRWLNHLAQLAAHSSNPLAQAIYLEGQGVLSAAEGAYPQARQMLEEASASWASLGRPYQQALSDVRRATLLLTHFQTDKTARREAESLLDRAVTLYQRLEVREGLAEIALLRQESHLAGQSKRRATLETQRRPFEGLTRREVQVLIQLSGGLTNKEIAAALLIAEGTVELHVSRILSKLGCETRTQAATYAQERNWLKSHLPG